MPNRLEDLLVAPADLTCLLVEVEGGRTFRVERLLQVGEQGRLLLIARGEAAGFGDLVEPETRPARRLRVLGDAVVILSVLGHSQRDPLPRRLRQDSAAQLRAHPRIRAQDSRRPGKHANELRYRAAGGLDALDERSALIRRRQLVVDLKSAYCGFYRHVASRFWLCLRGGTSLYRAVTWPLLYF